MHSLVAVPPAATLRRTDKLLPTSPSPLSLSGNYNIAKVFTIQVVKPNAGFVRLAVPSAEPLFPGAFTARHAHGFLPWGYTLCGSAAQL